MVAGEELLREEHQLCAGRTGLADQLGGPLDVGGHVPVDGDGLRHGDPQQKDMSGSGRSGSAAEGEEAGATVT